ncbi:hypothetical protein [Teredinibacter waterburyi]|uniref:hypothetical protein n=1 Tax=Teredinibacter waterburyi TaxID=1500538 RepID=UPI00165EE71B|nr:hypothetical protein [Teredinibacter waterburyi]
MKIELIKNTSTDHYDAVRWENSGEEVRLEFPYEISAVYADKIKKVVVEKFEIDKIGFYKLSGELDFYADIPSMDGYKFRGIKKNLQSKTGASLLFYPTESGKGNQWGDIEQYELVADSNCLGKYLNIYR